MYASKLKRLRRLHRSKSIVWFNAPIQYYNSSALLRFQFHNKTRSHIQYAPEITTKCIYHNKKTCTSIHKLTSGRTNIIMKLIPILESNRHENEMFFLILFQTLLTYNVSPHIVLPIGSTIVSNKFVSTFVTNPKPSSILRYQLVLAECATGSLAKLLCTQHVKPYCLKVLFFQIFYTIYCINHYFPSFRHNDLHIGNILYQPLAKIMIPQKNAYIVDNTIFYHDLSRCQYQVLLWDMYFSTMPTTRYTVKTVKLYKNRKQTTQYYDIHKIIDSMICILHKPYGQTTITAECQRFLDDIVPEHLRCRLHELKKHDVDKMQLHTSNHISLEDIIHHDYFRELTKVQNQTIAATYSLKSNIF